MSTRGKTTIRRVDAGGVRMACELTGPEGAPVVCLHHCFGSDLHYWDPHLPAFDGFRVLRYDTRGHGSSDTSAGPWRLETLAADVAGLLDALGIGRVHFCGVSLGGQIAQTFALDFPERVASLILVNTTCEYAEDQIALWRERARTVLEEGVEPLCAALMARWFTDEAAARRVPGYRYMEEALRRFAPRSFAAAAEAMCRLDTAPRLPRIAAPTLVIGSPEDPGVPQETTEKMAWLIPDAELVWLAPARHLASLEHPERFNALVRDFLSKRR